MKKNGFMEKEMALVEKERKIAVLTPESVDDAVLKAKALFRKGIKLVEIAYRNPSCPELIDSCIKAVRKEVPELFVAAATVTSKEIAKRGVKSGAMCIITPGFNLKTVKYCVSKKIPIFPGVATPGEIEMAMGFNLSLLKLFPCEVLGGLSFLKALNGPYPDVRFIVSGGITEENEKSYLDAKNVACVSGSYLCR